jgi:hypothetical protein
VGAEEEGEVTYTHGGIIRGGSGEGSDPFTWTPQAGEKVFCSDGRVMEFRPVEGGWQLVDIGVWDPKRIRTEFTAAELNKMQDVVDQTEGDV